MLVHTGIVPPPIDFMIDLLFVTSTKKKKNNIKISHLRQASCISHTPKTQCLTFLHFSDLCFVSNGRDKKFMILLIWWKASAFGVDIKWLSEQFILNEFIVCQWRQGSASNVRLNQQAKFLCYQQMNSFHNCHCNEQMIVRVCLDYIKWKIIFNSIRRKIETVRRSMQKFIYIYAICL